MLDTKQIGWSREEMAQKVAIDIPDGSIQTIAYMEDLPKIEQCKYMIPNYDGIEKYDKAKYEKSGASFPQGFKQNETKYIVTFWNRTDG